MLLVANEKMSLGEVLLLSLSKVLLSIILTVNFYENAILYCFAIFYVDTVHVSVEHVLTTERMITTQMNTTRMSYSV